jgi:hypothetical protein
MHFVPCTRPVGPLEEAPATSLWVEGGTQEERIDGFWCATDGAYYARVSPASIETPSARADISQPGAVAPGERWFRIADESEEEVGSARVIPLPVRPEREPRRPAMLLVGRMRAGGAQVAPVLLGATRPRR